MKKRTKIILIIIAVVIAYLFIEPQISGYIWRMDFESKNKDYMENAPSITMIGVIRSWTPIDGPSFSIFPEEQIDVDMTYDGIYLYGEKLSSSLNSQKVKVSGKLIENYTAYRLETSGFIFGGDPNTAVIFVSDIEIIDEEPGLQIVCDFLYNEWDKTVKQSLADESNKELVRKISNLYYKSEQMVCDTGQMSPNIP